MLTGRTKKEKKERKVLTLSGTEREEEKEKEHGETIKGPAPLGIIQKVQRFSEKEICLIGKEVGQSPMSYFGFAQFPYRGGQGSDENGHGFPFLSPPVQLARWALMHRFLSVCSL